MKSILTLILALTIFLSFVGCSPTKQADGTTPPLPSQPSASTDTPFNPVEKMDDYYAKLYIYRPAGQEDVIRLYLYECNLYNILGNPYSSTLNQGIWNMDGDVLILGEPDNGYRFQVTEDGLVFLAEGSREPGHDLHIEDGALFADQTPKGLTMVATGYELLSEDSIFPIQLYLKENGYYYLIGPTVNGARNKGNWTIDDNILRLYHVNNAEREFNWYFRVEDDGIVFLSENSDTFPLDVSVADGDKMVLINKPMTAYASKEYDCRPQNGGNNFSLWLYDNHHFEMAGPNLSIYGSWVMQEDRLILLDSYFSSHKYYYFQSTKEGFVFLEDESDTLTEDKALANGDVFVTEEPNFGKYTALYYTCTANEQDIPFRLYLFTGGSFALTLPGSEHGLIDGHWTIEKDIVTVTYPMYSEDHKTEDATMAFRLVGDTAVFHAAQSDPVPEEFGLTDGMRFDLVK